MTRDSPDYKLETGSESCSSKHNPVVPGSSPGGPTNSEKATDFFKPVAFFIKTIN